MTLTTQTQRWVYLGDGIETAYAYDARVDIASDMVAILDGAPSTISYTVTGLGDDNGGTVIFNSPPDAGVTIALERLLPLQQTTDYPVRGAFPAQDHEGTLDRIVMMLQQQRTALLDVYNYLGIDNGGGAIAPITGRIEPGMVVGWPFGVATIPSGWFLCDGTNSTPDLSARFVVGIDEDGSVFNAVGEIGGSTTTGSDGAAIVQSALETLGGSAADPEGLNSAGPSLGHTHDVTLPDHTHSSTPPYYTWCWIQYQGGQAAPRFIGTFPNQTFYDGETITPIDMSTEFVVGDGTNPVYTASGLPSGITIDPVTGIISGTVAAGANLLSPYSVVVQLTTSITPPATSFPASEWTITEFAPIAEGALIDLNPSTIVQTLGVVDSWDNSPSALGGATYQLENGNVDDVTVEQRNGLDVVKNAGGGSGYLIKLPSGIIISSPFTAFWVGGFDVNVNQSALMDSTTGAPTNRLALWDNNAGGIEFNIPTIMGTFATQARDTLGHVCAIRVESGNHRARISGGAWVTDATVGSLDWLWGASLENRDSVVLANGWNGRWIVFGSGLSNAEMDQKYDALLAEWGL